MIEVRQARYFQAVAEELHFGRAAERLAMSQPPLSQAIIQLERQLGVPLLRRTNRSVALTEAGRVFLEECRALVLAAERATEAAVKADAGIVGTLRIGAVASAFNETLPEAISRFQQSWPLVELRVQEIDSHHGHSGLLRRELDIAVIRQTVTRRDLQAVPIRRDHFIIAMPASHRLASASTPVRLEEFRDDSWVWISRQHTPDYHDELVAACREAGFSPEARHQANSIQAQLDMVECGLGVTLAPVSSLRRNPKGIVWRELRRRVDLIELSAVVRGGERDVLVDHFLEAIQDSTKLGQPDKHSRS